MASLKLNDHGIDVIKVQLLLNFCVHPCPFLLPSGHFNPQTQQAVIAFQASKGLKPDGIVGPMTLQGLGLTPAAVTPAPTPLKVNTPWLNIAQAEKGVMEDSRPGMHNKRILEYHKTTSLKATDDETPWCSSYVNWVMTQSKRKGTNNALAKSWLKWGVTVKQPAHGDIIVIRKKTAGLSSATGSSTGYHVGFYLTATPTYVRILGGNQKNQVKESNFSLKSFEVMGYRRPQ